MKVNMDNRFSFLSRQILTLCHVSLHLMPTHKVPFGVCIEMHLAFIWLQCKPICRNIRRFMPYTRSHVNLSFNYFSFYSEKSSFFSHFGWLEAYITHDPQPPLLWRLRCVCVTHKTIIYFKLIMIFFFFCMFMEFEFFKSEMLEQVKVWHFCWINYRFLIFCLFE